MVRKVKAEAAEAPKVEAAEAPKVEAAEAPKVDKLLVGKLAREFCQHDINIGKTVAALILANVVTRDGTDGDTDAVLAFKTAVSSDYDARHYKPQSYMVTDASTGAIKMCDKGTEGSAIVTIAYARGLTGAELSLLKGHRDNRDTVKGLVVSVRDGVNKYVDTIMSRLRRRAKEQNAEQGAPRTTRDFWTFFQDETKKILNRAVKDGICPKERAVIGISMLKEQLTK
jgi:hypothetical protein